MLWLLQLPTAVSTYLSPEVNLQYSGGPPSARYPLLHAIDRKVSRVSAPPPHIVHDTTKILILSWTSQVDTRLEVITIIFAKTSRFEAI
jgi:hypothetical protein